MSRPFFLAQLSDPHIGADWGFGDPTARLATAVRSVRGLGRPDAVLVSGDLADHGSDAEYEVVHELLDSLGAPVYVLTVPSTYVQARLNFEAQDSELTPEPAGFGVHVLVDGELTSHIEPVG